MRTGKAVALVAGFMLLSSLLCWPQATPAQPNFNVLAVRPVDRLPGKIDETRRIALKGSRHPLANSQNALGPVAPDQDLARMVLVLNPDAAQEAALEEFIRAQQDPASPYFHQWLTPQSFGQRFGVSQRDLAQLVKWLQSHGLQVDETPAGRRTIVFSGSASQVQSAFHTVIQKYSVDGESHFANATDPEIPVALAPLVRGVVSLHDFRSAPQIVVANPVFTLGNGAHFLAPQDWSTIYDVNPLFRQGLDGTGQSIAVLGRVNVAMQDVRAFRSQAGLPAHDPQVIVNGPDPGFPGCNDEVEAALDVEWAGAIASNADVKFVTSKSGATDGINLSAQYAVNHNVAPIVTLSYGLCEAAYSPAGSLFWNSLWAQAAAQGMSVFVSSGDSGAAGCDSPNLATATRGRGVNALCSSPNSTCVGGTQFNDGYNPSQYWAPSNGPGMGSALGYIPESAWNESGWSGGLWSSGGGASRIYSKPGWQAAPGVPADGMRDVPDLALHGAIQDAYVIQIQNQTFYVSGTSAATPAFASLMALIVENAAARLGNVNPILYSLANLQLTAAGAAVFHDVSSGSNTVPGVTGFNAGPGYDLATGLGSVDANLLLNHWTDRLASNFSISASPSSLSLVAGTSRSVTLTEIAQAGFSAPLSLSASGAPAGAGVTFSPATLAHSRSSTLTVTTSARTAAGSYPLTITATGGGLIRTALLSLTVTAAPTFTLVASATRASLRLGTPARITLTTTAMNGFKSPVVFSASGLPNGVAAAFLRGSIPSPGSGSSVFTLTEITGATSGAYNLLVTATGGGVTQTQPIALTLVAPTFALRLSSTSVSMRPGGSIAITITTAAAVGFNSPLALSLSGLPAGITATLSRLTIAAPGNGSSVVTLKAASSAAIRAYPLRITATGGGLTQTQNIVLTLRH